MQAAAVSAEFYGMPLFGYIEHLRAIRERYGDPAARLDVQFALAQRAAKAEQAREAANKAEAK